MKKPFYYAIFVWGLAACLASCTTLRVVSFDRLQAAEVSYPEQIRTVGVINYVPSLKLENKQMDYSSESLEGDGKVATEVLAQEIAATNYFNQVIICDSVLRGTVPETEWGQPLPSSMADSLMVSLGVDMLFSMERVQVQLQKSSLYTPGGMMPVPAVDGMITPVIRTYIPGRRTPLFSVSKSDTICWEMTPELTLEQVIRDASEYAAMMPISHLLPHWKEVERYYIDGGNAEMRDAGVYVREQNWAEASALWQSLYEKKKGKAKMHAAYNLALYCEMQDDLEQAREYLEVASSMAEENSWEEQLIFLYQLKLEEEAKKNRHLKIQMKRFEP